MAAVALELEHAIGFSGSARSPLHVHPDGHEMAYASGACVVIGDINDPHKQAFLRGHDNLISCLTMSRSGRYLVSAQTGDNADVVVWDWESRQLVYRMQEHDHGVMHVSITEDERFMLTVGVKGDNKMVVWDLTNGCIVSNRPNMETTTCACWGGRKKSIKGRDTTEYVIATGGDRSLKIWTLDPASGGVTDEKVNLGNQVRSFTRLSFSASRDYLYAASSSGDFSAVHVRSLTLHSVTQACSNGVLSLLVQTSPAGEDQLIVGGGDGSLSVFEGSGRSYRKAAGVELQGAVSAVVAMGGPDAAPGDDVRTYLAGTERGVIFHVELAQGQGRAAPMLESHFEPVRRAPSHPHPHTCASPQQAWRPGASSPCTTP